MPDLSKVTALLPDVADWLVYGAIVIVTLIGVFKCLFPLWGTTRALRRAISRLQAEAGQTTDKPVWQQAGFVGKRLRGSWLRFLQNAEQLDRRGLPTNVEDYINDDTVTHGPGNATLAELIPNLLTSLGILGTFMGLSSGLSTLNFADATQLVEGIPNLLQGMRFAFGTSVAGISCSLVFNMLNRISQGSSYRAIDEFVSSFTQLAMSRPLDNDVQLICQNQDRNFMLQGINETLVDRLAENVRRSLTQAMSPVADTMDRFLLGTTRNQIDGVNRIVSRFLDEMDRSMGNQFSALGATLDAMNQNQFNAARQTAETIASSEGIVHDARSLQQLTGQILDKFDAYVAEINAHRTRDEQFEQRSASLLQALQAQNQQLAGNITALGNKINALLDRSDDAVNQAMTEIRDLTASLSENVTSISKTLTTLAEEV